jgi:SH3-like domain-containing protein
MTKNKFSTTRSVAGSIVVCAFVLFPLAAKSEPVCVTAPKAALRSAPNLKGPVTWVVSQNMPLMRIENKNGWSQVIDLDGNKHWVSSKSISTKISCAVIKTKTAKLRRGPGVTKPEAELAIAERYTPFRKLDRDGSWLLVQDEYAGKYWVSETNVWIPITRSHIAF